MSGTDILIGAKSHGSLGEGSSLGIVDACFSMGEVMVSERLKLFGSLISLTT